MLSLSAVLYCNACSSGSSNAGSGNRLSLNLVVHGSRTSGTPSGTGDPRTLIIDVSAFGNFSRIS
jgi:hypothetical protein